MTTIRIGAAPEAFKGRGLYFDGETATPRKAELRIDEGQGALMLFVPGAEPVSWPLADIRALRDQAEGDMVILRSTQHALARLVLTSAEDREILRVRAASLHRSPPVEGKGRLAVWGSAAIGAVALMIFVLIPLMADTLAGLLPPSGKRALGEAVFEDVRVALDRTGVSPLAACEDGDGVAALDKMGARLFPDTDTQDELLVYVLDHEMVNAFALPGGIVVFMRGLLEEAQSPEEVAAVYAHEVGHVRARDPSRIALRTTGSAGVLGLLLGDFAGGAAVLFATNRLIQADYTQEAEAAADTFAHDAMLAAGLPPDAMADFFDRLRKEYGEAEGVVQYFLSHPALGDRIAAARTATPDGFSFEPVLTDGEWAALRGICGDTAADDMDGSTSDG
ncbi:MAG: M48 family metallopeptidase [Pseudomonadota bacterium]